MGENGLMLRGEELQGFCRRHGFKITSVEEICQYRLHNEISIRQIAEVPIDQSIGLERTQALAEAFQKYPDPGPVILHSDQGWHYQMRPYRKMLGEKGIEQSMSRKGNCYDNSVIVFFYGATTTEFYTNQMFSSIDEFKSALTEYIEYYNNSRIKVKLKGLSPVQFRTQSFCSH